MQARAAGLAPSVRFNPVLLKPGSDRTSQLVVRGRPVGTVGAADYFAHRDRLAGVVAAELAALRAEFDVVICEGAGSPAEINLRATDLANMGLARAADLPVVVVGDIDRGGLLAHLFGTVAVLDAGRPGADRRLRGQQVPRRPGAAGTRARPARRRSPAGPPTGSCPCQRRPVARRRGLAVGAWPRAGRRRAGAAARRATGCGWPRSGCRGSPTPPTSRRWPASPGVLVRWVDRPRRAGRRRPRGAARQQGHRGRPRLAARARAGRRGASRTPRRAGRCSASAAASRCWAGASTTPSSPARARSPGSGLLDADIEFAAEKVLCGTGTARCAATRSTTAGSPAAPRPTGSRRTAPQGSAAVRCTARTGTACSTTTTSVAAGCAEAAAAAGRPGFVVADDVSVPARRDAQLDVMADLLAAHLDVDALLGLLDGGPPMRPTVTSALRR